MLVMRDLELAMRYFDFSTYNARSGLITRDLKLVMRDLHLEHEISTYNARSLVSNVRSRLITRDLELPVRDLDL